MHVVNFAKVHRRINLFLIKIKYTLSEKEKKDSTYYYWISEENSERLINERF